MDRKYWIKVGFAMAAIFVVGTFVVRGVLAAIARGKEVVESVIPSGLPLMHAGFRIDNQRLGDISELQLLRSHPGRVDSAVMNVTLDSGASLATLDDCRLMIRDARHFDSHTRFSCAASSDSASLDLVPFGHIVLEPGDRTVTLWVPNEQVADLARNAVHGVGDSGNVDIRSDHGSFSVRVDGREVVSMRGDSAGGSVIVRDANGHPIVDISGDSNGGHVRIMDSQGNAKVDINGTSSHH